MIPGNQYSVVKLLATRSATLFIKLPKQAIINMQITSKLLFILLLTISQLACTLVPTTMKETLHDTSWVLHDVDGQALNTSYDISLEFSATKVSGFGGCNRYRGAYETKPESGIEVGFIMRSKKACHEEDRSKNEDMLMGRLETAQTYNFNEGTLIIKGELGSLGLTRNSTQ